MTQVTLTDAKEVVVVAITWRLRGRPAPRSTRSTQPGRPVPGLPVGGGRHRAGGRRRGVGHPVHRRVPRRPRATDDRGGGEPRVDADRPRPVSPTRSPRRSWRPTSTAPSRCPAPNSPRSPTPSEPSGCPRIRRGSGANWTSTGSGADAGRAWFGDLDIDGVHSLAGQVPINDINGVVLAVVSVSRALSVGVAAAQRRGRTPPGVPRTRRRTGGWRPGCCRGASSGRPAGWRSPRSRASPTTGKRCCTAFEKAWSPSTTTASSRCSTTARRRCST